jgi:acyl-CoA synthetase (AMP-forming)/AMP-acid ligase II
MGDIGMLREDGNLRLIARTKQVFRSGGYNIYPREIELVLEGHPSVKLAAVVPRPDPGYQEVGVAYVELQPDAQATAAELLGWVRGRLANYKVPKSLVLLAELPTLPNEKIDKRRLQRLATSTPAPDLQQLPKAACLAVCDRRSYGWVAPLWWTDGVGQAVPSHLRLRRT